MKKLTLITETCNEYFIFVIYNIQHLVYEENHLIIVGDLCKIVIKIINNDNDEVVDVSFKKLNKDRNLRSEFDLGTWKIINNLREDAPEIFKLGKEKLRYINAIFNMI